MGGPGSGIKDRDARNMTKMRGGGGKEKGGSRKEVRREVRSKYLFRSVIQHTRDLWSKPEI